LVALNPVRDLLFRAKDLFVAAIGGGGHDEKEEAPAGGGNASRLLFCAKNLLVETKAPQAPAPKPLR
jgi:hypothetical protein